MLLKNHVAVQNFRLETMRQDPKGLVFTMNQMSLASYAKLGGRPWLLGAEQTVAHELVIGLAAMWRPTAGSAVARDMWALPQCSPAMVDIISASGQAWFRLKTIPQRLPRR